MVFIVIYWSKFLFNHLWNCISISYFYFFVCNQVFDGIITYIVLRVGNYIEKYCKNALFYALLLHTFNFF